MRKSFTSDRHLGLVAAATLLVASAVSASACEPIVPLFKVLAGPNWIPGTLAGLLAAVAIKCFAFAMYEKSMPAGEAIGLMFLGNIASTFVGVFVAALSAPPFLLLSFPLVFVVSRVAMASVSTRVGWPPLQKTSPGTLAGVLMGVLFLTYLLFGFASVVQDTSSRWYWVCKVAAVYGALILSMAITTLYEEWVIYSSVAKEQRAINYFPAVIRANVLTMFVVFGIAAAFMLPKRFASPRFLVTWLMDRAAELLAMITG